jgi:hypothetical protein
MLTGDPIRELQTRFSDRRRTTQKYLPGAVEESSKPAHEQQHDNNQEN